MSLLLASDPAAAQQFASTVVSAADPTAASNLPLGIKNEFRFTAGVAGRRGRRGDLLLHDEQGEYGLVIEAKLGTQCHYKQIADYLSCRTDGLGLRDNAKLDVVLVASRALAPHLGSRRTRRRDRWRGCVTWIEVFDGLSKVTFADPDGTCAWKKLLKHYRHRAGFGTASSTYLPANATLNAGIGTIVAAMRSAGAPLGVEVWAEPFRPKSQLVVSGTQAKASARIAIAGRGLRNASVVVTFDRSGPRGAAHYEWTERGTRTAWSTTVPKARVDTTTAIAGELAQRVAARATE